MGPLVDKSDVCITSEAVSTPRTDGVRVEVRMPFFKTVLLISSPVEVATKINVFLLTEFDLQGDRASLLPVSGSIIIVIYPCTQHWMDVTR